MLDSLRPLGDHVDEFFEAGIDPDWITIGFRYALEDQRATSSQDGEAQRFDISSLVCEVKLAYNQNPGRFSISRGHDLSDLSFFSVAIVILCSLEKQKSQ